MGKEAILVIFFNLIVYIHKLGQPKGGGGGMASPGPYEGPPLGKPPELLRLGVIVSQPLDI